MKNSIRSFVALVLSSATGAHAQQPAVLETEQQAADPAGLCGDVAWGHACWQKLQSHPACYVWNRWPVDPDRWLHGDETATWTGQCSGGWVEGTGTLTVTGPGRPWTGEGSWVAGKPHGMLNVRFESKV